MPLLQEIPGVKGARLKDYTFSDIYVSTDPTRPPLVRRMTLSGSGERPLNGVHRVPEVVVEDVGRLIDETRAASMRRGFFEREVQVTHDGVTYRAGLIAEPSRKAGNPYELQPPDIQTWCLRRVGDTPPKLEDLNLPLSLYRAIRESCNDRGLVLMSGSFGSGKSTAAAASLQDWVQQTGEVGVTLEDPPEFRMDNDYGTGKIYQINTNDTDPAEAIKHVRRYAPRYVFLGEVRTPETARELLHISASGPLAMCTIQASDPIQALTSLILFASSSMSGDMAQQIAARGISMIIHLEMAADGPKANMLRIADNDHGIQSRIRSGRYDLLYEDFDNQRIRRKRDSGPSTNRVGGLRN